MRLKFTKMQGAGNDFVVFDGVRQRVALAPSQWRALADRHFGVGADQLLLVEPGDGPDVDFVYRIFNADGGEVEQCGNGARCFVRFVLDQGLTAKRAIRVRTMAGVIEPRMEDDGRVTVDMGEPVLDPARVPFDASGLEGRREGEDTLWPLALPGGTRWVSVVSMGNPHAVQVVDDVDTAPVAVEGPLVEAHPRFPRRVNAGFLQVVSPERARLRVFERGAGETLACGSGACAAVVAGIRRGRLAPRVDVATRGGVLTIDWRGGPVRMTGPATSVFTGEIDLDAAFPTDLPAAA
ncbi:MAG: diaminopimelate epimerase [Burkholderiaceae bacterium]|jgi:diaminopimelate epimerase|nr:diaminopimelate epimerase [Burkholderiales bacterium]MCZ8104265.1 diaminopimelate epimerase [Burkholderiales bacterium]MCZ8337494.1 diaminopimelate epimerase [Burkholderiaceae bacterium]